MEEQMGVPGINRITWFWALVFTFFTSGVFAMAVALYLSIWLRLRRKTGLAVYGYLIVAVLTILELLPARMLSHSVPLEAIFTAGAVLWIITAFVLRREFQLYYARPDGSLPPISPLWTALFSVYYLNYWLWVLRDTV